MRLLIINPNTSELVSRLIGEAARQAASATTDITVVSAPFGSSALESVADSTIAAHAVLTALAQNWKLNDAAIVAAFSDPGLAAAREVSPISVFGLAECAMTAAAADHRRFSILTLGRHLEEMIRRQAEDYGVGRQLHSIEFLDATVSELSNRQEALAGAVAGLGRDAVSKGAEAVVLGGGPFSGLGAPVAEAVAVPVIDGIVAAVHRAESAEPPPAGPRSDTKAAASHKAYRGLVPELVALLVRMADSRNARP